MLAECAGSSPLRTIGITAVCTEQVHRQSFKDRLVALRALTGEKMLDADLFEPLNHVRA